MARKKRATQLFEGESQKKRAPPDLKSYLIELNLQMDWLLQRIEFIEWSGDAIIWADGFTEMERLTLLLEDRRYFRHAGFDWRGVPRVLRQVMTFKRIGGVSTIEQQLVRTLLERRERTVRRKSREMLLAWILTHRKSKQSVLRAYLATAYFGYKLRGCDQASNLVFGIDADQLKVEQASFLASLLVYPLPRVVRDEAGRHPIFPTSDIASMLAATMSVAPRWTSNVKRRSAYGIALSRKTK